MASLRKLDNSLVKVNPEFTAALAQFNVDFSVLKVDAPKTYAGLGQALSQKRRQDAESGSPHVTVRRLKALFKDKIPTTPLLLDAYGARASEIAQHDDVFRSRHRMKNYGVFEEFIGPDATSIWAAATSGREAIAIHLLACMIARVWSPAEATSIWTELVNAQKNEIQEKSSEGTEDIVGFLASLPDMDRSAFAELDNSARAWMRRGDEVQSVRQTQVKLILDNMDIPVGVNLSTFPNVMEGWSIALNGMEALLRGESQRVNHGALALALSSWHLYPDLELPGDRHIEQRDPLFDKNGDVILGIQAPPSQVPRGVYWSLSLSKLRLYGAPERCEQRFKVESSRLSLEQLKFVVLGGLINTWMTEGYTIEMSCRLIVKLDEIVFQGNLNLTALPWLPLLSKVAKIYLSTKNDSEILMMKKLIRLGRSHGRNILGPLTGHPGLFFGLGTSEQFVPLIKTADDQVALLRTIARRRFPTANAEDVIIQYRHPVQRTDTIPQAHLQKLFENNASNSEDTVGRVGEKRSMHESMSTGETSMATQQEHNSKKVKFEAKQGSEEGTFDLQQDSPLNRSPSPPLFADDDTMSGVDQEDEKTVYELPMHSKDVQAWLEADEFLSAVTMPRQSSYKVMDPEHVSKSAKANHWHLDYVTAFANSDGRYHRWTARMADSERGDWNRICWTELTTCIEHETAAERSHDLDSEHVHPLPQVIMTSLKKPFHSICLSFRRNPFATHSNLSRPVKFECQVGGNSDVALLVNSSLLEAGINVKKQPSWLAGAAVPVESLVRAEDIENAIDKETIDFAELRLAFLRSIRGTARDTTHWTFWRSLMALAFIDSVYENMPDATIDPAVVSNPLCSGKWFANKQNLFYSQISMRREEAFGCIAYYESGLDAELSTFNNVMAISSADSIYVDAALLEDPLYSSRGGTVKRILGNVGKPGTVLLIPPPNPMCLEPLPEDWKLLDVEPFDGQVKDSFANTTLHMSFTGWSAPVHLPGASSGRLTTEAHVVETLVSLHAGSKWIADLDILDAVSKAGGSWDHDHYYQCGCSHLPEARNLSGLPNGIEMTSINNWEGFLDRPTGPVIMMTHKNWIARLSTVALAVRRGDRVLLGDGVCWQCCKDLHSLGGPGVLQRTLLVA